MKAKFLKTLAIGGSCFLFGCASNRAPVRPMVLTATEEKILNLEEQIKNQQDQIASLSDTLKHFREKNVGRYSHQMKKGQAKTGKKMAPAKVLRTQKLYPPSLAMEKKVPAKDLFMEGETLADSSQSAMHFYYKGLQMMTEKKFEEALQALRVFITQNPRHVYADRAQYLIADSHFQTKDFNLVVVATNLLEARYPYSVKLPDALYKRSLSFIEMSQSDQARVTLRNLLQKFPNDLLAQPAQKKLVELSSTARK